MSGDTDSALQGVRLDVEARFLQATLRTARLALLQELRRIRRATLLIDLLPPLGWFGARSRLELAADSHAKADENLKRALDRIDDIGAAITPTPAEPTDGSAAQAAGQALREAKSPLHAEAETAGGEQ